MLALERAIYAKLDGDATLTALLAAQHNVFPEVIPADKSLPAVVFAQIGQGEDAYTYGTHAFETLDYLVKAVTVGYDPESAQAIADRIFALLNNVVLSISGSTQMMCHRLGRVSYPERGDAGDHYNHRGGIYRWIVQ